MDIQHEQIDYDTSLPFKIFTFQSPTPGQQFPPHWHQSTELLYCAKGKLKVTLPNHTYVLYEGQLIIINPNQIHATQTLSPHLVLCIELPLTLLNEISQNRFLNSFVFDTNKCVNNPHNFAELKNKLNHLLNTYNLKENSISKNIDMICDTYQIIKYLINGNSITIKSTYTESNINFAEKIINFIDKHYSEDLTLKDVSDYCSYSTSYTSRMIKKNLGTTFSDLLISIRLTKALILLKKPNIHLINIAQKTGFKDYRNFYNCFMKVYHISPGQFRKSLSFNNLAKSD